MRRAFLSFTALVFLGNAIIAFMGYPGVLWSLVVFGPFILLGIYDMLQKKHTIMRNYPVFGRGRYVLEELRPKVYQYFVESDIDGTPINRIKRSVVYQRAKKVLDTSPFGTQVDVYEEGYEWMNHSIGALDAHDLNQDPRTKVGSSQCTKPYSCSIFNIGAMSYGSLSSRAVMALNGGAKIGNFAHNTGEGGISPFHLKYGADVIYQVGTGYFGCRAPDGNFDPDLFKERTADDRVKMIELKLSQGAKPGHGGILPARKVTPEIAEIRNVPLGKDIISPPFHCAFSTPVGLLEFIARMRDLAGGKPVGFKMCIGNKGEFISICKAILKTGIYPDFIAIDSAEGGTGAAPLEFSNSVGMPGREALIFAYDTLVGFGIKHEIKLFYAGKVLSGFDIFKAIALGADACYSARGMMLALGCIQALLCNKNTCPVGVTTQDKELERGLVVSDKKIRVANYHRETIVSFLELMGASGIDDLDKINRHHINRRVGSNKVKTYEEIYPTMPQGALLDSALWPMDYHYAMKTSSENSFGIDI